MSGFFFFPLGSVLGGGYQITQGHKTTVTGEQTFHAFEAMIYEQIE